MKKPSVASKVRKVLLKYYTSVLPMLVNDLVTVFVMELSPEESKRFNEYQKTKQPCGHPVACIEGAPDFAGDKHPTTQYCGWCEDHAAAYRKGAEDMREKAAAIFEDSMRHKSFAPVTLFRIQREIRDLPLPKEKP